MAGRTGSWDVIGTQSADRSGAGNRHHSPLPEARMYESGAQQRPHSPSTPHLRVMGPSVPSLDARPSSNAAPASPVSPDLTRPLPLASSPESTRGTSARILLVEDNPDNRNIYRVILEHTGYTVVEATDGEEALRAAREEGPDLILMDLSIPKMNGLEVTRILKNDSATRHVPIIALTAFAMASDRLKAAEAGCDGYLAKPVEPRAVVEEVRQQLSRKDRLV